MTLQLSTFLLLSALMCGCTRAPSPVNVMEHTAATAPKDSYVLLWPPRNKIREGVCYHIKNTGGNVYELIEGAPK